jgi:hypothetical protein
MRWRCGLLRWVAAGVVVIVASGCYTPRANIDWVDFVRLHGASYDRVTVEAPAPEASQLGPVVGTVDKTLSDSVHDPSYQARDGDAGFLVKGTRLHALRGVGAWFRIAAVVNDQVVVYQLDNPRARTGADLYDLSDVRSIQVRNVRTPGLNLRTVTDRRTIAVAVAELMHDRVGHGTSSQPTCDIRFDYAGSAPLVLSYYASTATIGPAQLQLPAVLRNTISAAQCD